MSTRTQQALSTTRGSGSRADSKNLFGEPLWNGWPYGDRTYPFRDGRTDPTPLRLEQCRVDDQLIVRAEVPGVDDLDDLGVEITGGVLSITAERRPREGEGVVQSEFRYGPFLRQILLPQGLAAEVESVGYRDGVLEVRIRHEVAGQVLHAAAPPTSCGADERARRGR